ncbi:unnamed protein product [Schistosoma margrebowiei]|uniref:GDP/GTP exchange factor Sec2 N-terminal domain-containing protein n=1 Tax=Schistosoma margrebowiei TaxID=48269 RepID=A0AA84ZUU9_9TREM|nr:unnamed protein product [Schistosoma margrebowiei]
MNVDESKSMTCNDMISLEEKVKLTSEENIGLKSYIERMNSECMELNATLFEEANRMVHEALSKEHYAVRQAKEKIQENEILQSEVRALKLLVAELSSSITNQKIKNSLYSTRMKYDNIACNKSPEIHRKLGTGNLLELRRNNAKYGGLEQFNRRDLLTAMITHRPCKNNLDVDTFEEFLEWIQNDCPLNLPMIAFTELNEQLLCHQENIKKGQIKEYTRKEINERVTKINIPDQISNKTVINNQIDENITISNNNNNNNNEKNNHLTLSNNFGVHNSVNDIENIPNSNNNYDNNAKNQESNHSIHIIKITESNNHDIIKEISNDSINNHNDSQVKTDDKYYSPIIINCVKTKSSFNSNYFPLDKPLSKFIYRLYLQDIKPCFEFINKKLISSIYQALPELGLEITPITPELSGGLRRNNDINGGDKTVKVVHEYCSLMPKYEAVFRMKIRTPDSNEIDCKISLPARDRLVAIVNLFQYLSIIKRGLDSSPMISTNRKNDNHFINLKNRNNYHNNDKEAITKEVEIQEQQFRTIQRHRLNIALARLGYGTPDLE